MATVWPGCMRGRAFSSVISGVVYFFKGFLASGSLSAQGADLESASEHPSLLSSDGRGANDSARIVGVDYQHQLLSLGPGPPPRTGTMNSQRCVAVHVAPKAVNQPPVLGLVRDKAVGLGGERENGDGRGIFAHAASVAETAWSPLFVAGFECFMYVHREVT